jgi:hypothetical protein
MSILSALGFGVSSRETYRGWIERTLSDSAELPVAGYPHLRLYRWTVGDQGIALWAVVEDGEERRTVSFFPAFRARAVSPFALDSLSFPDNPYEPVASGRTHDALDVHVVNYLCLERDALQPQTVLPARIIGLAGQGIAIEPPDEALFPVLLMQARTVHNDLEILPNVYGIAGTIREFEIITNPASDKQLAWLRLGLEGTQDAEIVGDVEGVQGTLAPGHVAFAECYLQAEFEA